MFIFSCVLLLAPAFQALGDTSSVNRELLRLQGFSEHQKENKELDQERLSGIAEIKKDRDAWSKRQAHDITEYKKWKAVEGKTPDESSPEYREDLKIKNQERRELTDEAQQYSQRQEHLRQEVELKRPFKECKEYDVCNVEQQRVPQKDRLLYGNKPQYLHAQLPGSGGGSSSSAGGSSSGMTQPYSPSPGIGTAPEFYEPDVPPPPPPPVMPEGGGFDDQVPPPIFDDSNY